MNEIDAPATTDRQISANRLNALNSTGPRTDAGKKASALNARKHGLRARDILLPSECPKSYNQFLLQLVEHFAPGDVIEAMLVERLATTSWRLKRLLAVERNVMEDFAMSVADRIAYLSVLSKYESTLDRVFHRTLAELHRFLD